MKDKGFVEGVLVVPMTGLALVLLLGVATLFSIWEGWVVSTIWGWHLVPFGLPALPVHAAIAADLVITLFTAHLMPNKSVAWSTMLLQGIMRPAFALGIAWLVL